MNDQIPCTLRDRFVPRARLATGAITTLIDTSQAEQAADGATEMNEGKFAGWRKSSHSGDGNSCIEVATAVHGGSQGRGVGVRDSQQDGGGPVLEFGRDVWTEFIVRAENPLSLGGRPLRPVMMSGGRPPRSPGARSSGLATAKACAAVCANQ